MDMQQQMFATLIIIIVATISVRNQSAQVYGGYDILCCFYNCPSDVVVVIVERNIECIFFGYSLLLVLYVFVVVAR